MGAGRGKPAAPASSDSQTENQPGIRKRLPCEIRMQKDVDELDLPPNTKVDFPDKDELRDFEVTITPDEGFWAGASYSFKFHVPTEYPHAPPKVLCTTKIFHPNIDLEGKVCLNILRDEWKPVLAFSSIIYGLLHLFLDPNPNDPLNKEAAAILREEPKRFKQLVTDSLVGKTILGEDFPRLV